jgi:alpha-N-arabinofuranosidase
MPDARADIILLADKSLGTVRDRLFGQFVELAGRCINDGLYDPASPQARADGLRGDVIAALKELRPGYLRYPGGCATSYFDWQELVGPVEARPRAKLFRSSGQVQSTAFGIPEAHALCRELGAELYLTVNAHTQSPEDAANLVEYLNGVKPTQYAELRRAHGRAEPFGVKLFGLGNEIYGSWQAGQKTAAAYAAWCAEAIRQMKAVDPDIQVVVCGLGRPDPEWDRTVLFRLIGQADMISMHNYFGRPVFADLMGASRVCEQMFRSADCLIDEAMDLALGAHSRTPRDFGAPPTVRARPAIAFDEWNVWYRASHGAVGDLEEVYNYADALAVASILHVVLRNAKSTGLSGISLAVNTLGGLFTDRTRMARQTIWHAQKLIRDAHAGRVVDTVVDGPVFKAKHERFFCGIVSPEKAADETRPSLLHFDDLPALDVAASVDDARRKLTISVVQKLPDRPITARLALHGVRATGDEMVLSRLTGGQDLSAANTLDHPDRVGIETLRVKRGADITFPPASLTVLKMDLE